MDKMACRTSAECCEGKLGPDEGGDAGDMRRGHAGAVFGAIAPAGQRAEDADAGSG